MKRYPALPAELIIGSLVLGIAIQWLGLLATPVSDAPALVVVDRLLCWCSDFFQDDVLRCRRGPAADHRLPARAAHGPGGRLHGTKGLRSQLLRAG